MSLQGIVAWASALINTTAWGQLHPRKGFGSGHTRPTLVQHGSASFIQTAGEEWEEKELGEAGKK